ncbi:polysaccharide deacetylase [Clostridium sp. SYSU_GA19001]|uniref:polysaccharide deacetylase family protein n=1 Tax=Clostridium caldaquaticum TaxID=2940653 RepID=UPI002077339F|nr:polysaccharide deacetylase family protein [Clostridium caldaquaticum]MCM8709681.1 polysaccharide deacetylase [Clostridium caldaquaticum]
MKKGFKHYLYLIVGIFILSAVGITILKKVSAEETEDGEQKNIYLTFDDGPSYIVTSKILDILKEKEVKATFFVVGNKIEGREDILKRMYEEGHSIGLHTFTHKYRQIYSSHEKFIKEMDDTGKEVNRVLGFTPKIIRFPGGSKPHLNSELLSKLHEKNYRIYDWNASLSDGLDYNTPSDKLVREAHKVVGKAYSNIFLLLHCDQTNKTTAKALPEIIDYYRNLGYEFKTITENTTEYYFRFK